MMCAMKSTTSRQPKKLICQILIYERAEQPENETAVQFMGNSSSVMLNDFQR